MNPTPKAFVIIGSLLITGWMGATIVASDVDNWADDELSRMHEADKGATIGSTVGGEVLLVDQDTEAATSPPGLHP